MTLHSYLRGASRDLCAVYNRLPDEHPMKKPLGDLLWEMGRAGHNENAKLVNMKPVEIKITEAA